MWKKGLITFFLEIVILAPSELKLSFNVSNIEKKKEFLTMHTYFKNIHTIEYWGSIMASIM